MLDLSSFLNLNSTWLPLVLLFVSIFGSAHCLVMCVPILSSQRATNYSHYHFGRLISYLTVATIFFYVGQSILENQFLSLAIGMVFLSYFSWISFREYRAKGCCVKSKPQQKNLFILGLVNGFLPCGWLFLIFILLSKTQSYPIFLLYVGIFWLGTVPVFYVLNLKKIVNNFLPFVQYKPTVTLFYFIFAFYSFSLHFEKPKSIEQAHSSNFFCRVQDIQK